MRTLLFVPANRPNMVAHAHQTPADVILLDLEDSVPPGEKSAARTGLHESIQSLKAAGKMVHVRVNHPDTGLTKDDLAAAVGPGLDGLALPKVDGPRDVRAADVMIREAELHGGVRPGTVGLVAHIESARGVLRCEEIATASTRLIGLALSGYDYTADLGVDRTREGVELDYARRVIVHVAVAHRLQPLDTVYGDFNDEEGLLAEAAYAKQIGFKGKHVIHPVQVEPVNDVFAPKAEDVDYARRIIAVYEEAETRGEASVQLEGKMVDIAIVRRARDVLAFAEAVSRGR
jgi:citrate lyase subunit beta/citryl-CoA lyase